MCGSTSFNQEEMTLEIHLWTTLQHAMGLKAMTVEAGLDLGIKARLVALMSLMIIL